MVGCDIDERMAYRMIYGNCYFHLQAVLTREERAGLAARIRRNRNIVAVTVDERRVHILSLIHI